MCVCVSVAAAISMFNLSDGDDDDDEEDMGTHGFSDFARKRSDVGEKANLISKRWYLVKSEL